MLIVASVIATCVLLCEPHPTFQVVYRCCNFILVPWRWLFYSKNVIYYFKGWFLLFPLVWYRFVLSFNELLCFLTYFMPLTSFHTPWKYLMFPWGVEIDQWHRAYSGHTKRTCLDLHIAYQLLNFPYQFTRSFFLFIYSQ